MGPLLLIALVGTAGAGEQLVSADVDLGAVYRTNVFGSKTNPEGAPYLHLSPGLSVEHSTEELGLSLSAEYLLRKHLAMPYTQVDRFGDFRVDGELELGRTGPVGFTLRDRAWRLPWDEVEEAFPQPRAASALAHNDLSADLVLRPHDAVELSMGGHWALDAYALPMGAQIIDTKGLNRRHGLGPTAEVRWTVAPDQVLLVGGSATLHRWSDNWILAIDSVPLPNELSFGNYLAMPDSTHAQVLGGYEGQLAEGLGLRVHAGYALAAYDEQSVLDDAADEVITDPAELSDAAGYFVDASGLEHLIAGAELRYEVAPEATLSLGYTRALGDSWITNYAATDGVTAGVDLTVADRVGITAEGGLRLEHYRGEVVRDDAVVRVSGGVSLELTEWAAIRAGARWDERASTYAPDEYDDVRVSALATLTY